MLEKLMQAAFITFLLQLISVLSHTTPMHPKAVSHLSDVSTPVISSTFEVSE